MPTPEDNLMAGWSLFTKDTAFPFRNQDGTKGYINWNMFPETSIGLQYGFRSGNGHFYGDQEVHSAILYYLAQMWLTIFAENEINNPVPQTLMNNSGHFDMRTGAAFLGWCM